MDSGEDTYEKFAIAILQLCLNPDSNIYHCQSHSLSCSGYKINISYMLKLLHYHSFKANYYSRY